MAEQPTLLYAGVDEAGYGPMLGPLCVALSLFEVRGWSDGDPPPDLWERLRAVVCRCPAEERGGRISVNDSKRLKGPGGPDDPRALARLERAVLLFLALRDGPDVCASDRSLHAALGASLEPHAWYGGDDLPLPVAPGAGSLAMAVNSAAAACEAAGARPIALRACVVGESGFNDGCESGGSKAAVNFGAAMRLVRLVWTEHAPGCAAPGGPRVVLDRHGGRTCYAESLERALPGAEVTDAIETPAASWIALQGKDGRRMTVIVQPEAESSHLPVALASMTAKYLRELAMRRFNRYWCARSPGLAPTAGYVQDARRWLQDVGGVISADERRTLVRRW